MKSFWLFLGLFGCSSVCLAIEMPQTAQEIGCTNCHAVDHKVVGPAWMDVSKRYRESRDSKVVFNALVKKVSTGGYGNWGDVPMVPNDPVGTRHEKIVELVKFVLSLSDQLPENQRK